MNLSTRTPWLAYGLALFMCVLTSALCAQETKEYDAVYLKDGTVVYGQIMRYDPQEKLVLQLENGSSLEYKATEVVRIKKEAVAVKLVNAQQEERDRISDTVRVQPYEPHRVYGWIGMGNVFGDSPSSDFPGFSLEGGAGYRLHHLLGIGVGAGVTTEYEQTIAYGYGSIFGALLKRSYSPFYQLDVGYGGPLRNDPYLLLVTPNAPGPTVYKKQGGLYLHPSIGFRFSSRTMLHTYLALGFVIQNVRYQGIDWNNFDFDERLSFVRVSLRVGMQF